MKFSLLGPSGTLSEIAIKMFYPGVGFIQENTIDDVLKALQLDQVDHAFIPFKRNDEDYIPTTLSLIAKNNLYINESKMLKVKLCIAGFQDIKDAKRLYSFPYAYKVCKQKLKKNSFQGDIVLAKNVTEAALMAKDDPQGVALTSKVCCENHNLPLVKDNIQDAKNSCLEMVLLSKKASLQKGLRREFYYFTSSQKFETVYEKIKDLLKTSFELKNFVSEDDTLEQYLLIFEHDSNDDCPLKNTFFNIKHLGSYCL